MLISCSIAIFTCLVFYFSGCIADRNFTPGVSVRDNIVEAIQSSCKVILVLTDHFVSSQWCQCEANQAIMRSLGLNDVQDQDCNSNCVIPVLLEECKIPIKLQHFTYSDMTIEQDFVFEMRRLKRALLPEVLWGTVECLLFLWINTIFVIYHSLLFQNFIYFSIKLCFTKFYFKYTSNAVPSHIKPNLLDLWSPNRYSYVWLVVGLSPCSKFVTKHESDGKKIKFSRIWDLWLDRVNTRILVNQSNHRLTTKLVFEYFSADMGTSESSQCSILQS